MKGLLIRILLIFILLSFVTGCWNRRELNELAISAAMGIDYAEDGQFLVTVQIINPTAIALQESGSSSYSPVVAFHGKGDTMFEALRRLTTQIPRKIYESYTKVVIFGENFAKSGISEGLDFLLRDHEFRADFFFLVAKDMKAKEILEVLTILDKIPANELYQSLQTSHKTWGTTETVTIDNLINELASKGNAPALPGVFILGNLKEGESIDSLNQSELPAILANNDLAVFNQDRLVGWLNDSESRGYNFTQSEINSTIINIPCQQSENEKIGIEILATSAKVQTTVVENKIKGEVKVSADAQIGNTLCSMNFDEKETMTSIEEKTNNEIKQEVIASIKKAQALGTDIFGFGDALYRSNLKEWKKKESEWNQTFMEMDFDVAVDVNIRGKGNITNSVKKIIEGL
ncbi:Ger(x)C family spore germination protein [Alkalihalobacillus sp. 1P02AB]|uniref:Ger(x)C family spore germination protein n=1 Tax=Alkalihalobacillus sp. 1P02AB TaxID=3132260 RepID=UPI0039A69B47